MATLVKQPTLPPTLTDRLRSTVAEQLAVLASAILPTSILGADLGADELDMVELWLAVEEDYGVQVDSEEFNRILTFEELVAAVSIRTEVSA